MTNIDISPEAVEHLCAIHEGYEQHGTVATLRALSDECERLKGINKKLCADFNLMNQHGAKQDAALTQSRAETAAVIERAAQVYIDGDWDWFSDADDAIRALATPEQSSALAAIEAAAEARGRRTGIATEKLERLVNWLKEDEDNVFLLPAGDIEKMRAILAAVPQGENK